MGFSFSEEMLVMFAFTDKVMEDFFQSFRDAEIASVGLIATITPTISTGPQNSYMRRFQKNMLV